MGKKTPKQSPKKDAANKDKKTDSRSAGISLPSKKDDPITVDEQKIDLQGKMQQCALTDDKSEPVQVAQESTATNILSENKKQDGHEEEEEEPWDFDIEMRELLDMLQSPYFVGEDEKASATFQILEALLNEDKTWTTTKQLMDRVMTIQAEIVAKVPHETTPRNVIYKFRRIVLDEFMSAIKSYIPHVDIDSAVNYFRAAAVSQEIATTDLPAVPAAADEDLIAQKVKSSVIDVIMEYRMELENIPELVGKQGPEVIKEGDVVLTYSFCPLTARLLRQAAQHVNYTLYIVESQPLCYGYLTLQELSDLVGHSITAIMIGDSSIEPVLHHKATKVILPAVSVMPNGDVKMIAFGSTIATMANLYNREVYAVAASYQFSIAAIQFANIQLDPNMITTAFESDVVYATYKYDKTPSDAVHRFITNGATCGPGHIARVFSEQYGSAFAREERKKLLRQTLGGGFVKM